MAVNPASPRMTNPAQYQALQGKSAGEKATVAAPAAGGAPPQQAKPAGGAAPAGAGAGAPGAAPAQQDPVALIQKVITLLKASAQALSGLVGGKAPEGPQASPGGAAPGGAAPGGAAPGGPSGGAAKKNDPVGVITEAAKGLGAIINALQNLVGGAAGGSPKPSASVPPNPQAPPAPGGPGGAAGAGGDD